MTAAAEQVVFDSSAILATVFDEPGGDRVRALWLNGVVSTVNATEVVAKFIDRGMTREAAEEAFAILGLTMIDFDSGRALASGLLRSETRARCLSLADRACLALAAELAAPAVTGDRAWADLDLGVEVEVIR